MKSDETRPIFCSAGNERADAVVNPNAAPKIRCPRCGAEDDLEKAITAAAKHHLSQMLGSAFSGRGGGNITVKRSSEPTPRFIFG